MVVGEVTRTWPILGTYEVVASSFFALSLSWIFEQGVRLEKESHTSVLKSLFMCKSEISSFA